MNCDRCGRQLEGAPEPTKDTGLCGECLTRMIDDELGCPKYPGRLCVAVLERTGVCAFGCAHDAAEERRP